MSQQLEDREHMRELSVVDALAALSTDLRGLTEAKVEERLKFYGPNSIARLSKQSLIKEFLANFTHLMALLLWIGGAVAFLAQMPQLGIAIWLVNLINGGFSFWQEYRAEKATEALLGLLPLNAHVIRGGQEMRVPAEQLVPGDIIVLSEGDHISADARIISAFALSVDESTLSGESRPVRKTAEVALPVAAPHNHSTNLVANLATNLVFAGTSVLSGTCRAVIFATGMKTRFGRIAHLTQTIGDDPSPLQKEMGRVTRIVTVLATSIGALFFLLAVLVAHIQPGEGFVFAMGMIVAFVPEGMLPTVSLALAMGVQRMARRNALVKKLSAVETLGSTSVICTDKTGTITQNQMTVQKIWVSEREYVLTGIGYSPDGKIEAADGSIGSKFKESTLEKLLVAGMRCNNAKLQPPHVDAPGWTVLGDPTEGALLVAARKGGVTPESQSFEAHRICELPFDSHRKRMSTVYDIGGSRVLYLKGAPAEVLSRCTAIGCENGQRPICELDKVHTMAANDTYAYEGLRVLGIAMRLIPADLHDLTPDFLERESLLFVDW